jgi:hypothetical protein
MELLNCDMELAGGGTTKFGAIEPGRDLEGLVLSPVQGVPSISVRQPQKS